MATLQVSANTCKIAHFRCLLFTLRIGSRRVFLSINLSCCFYKDGKLAVSFTKRLTFEIIKVLVRHFENLLCDGRKRQKYKLTGFARPQKQLVIF